MLAVVPALLAETTAAAGLYTVLLLAAGIVFFAGRDSREEEPVYRPIRGFSNMCAYNIPAKRAHNLHSLQILLHFLRRIPMHHRPIFR